MLSDVTGFLIFFDLVGFLPSSFFFIIHSSALSLLYILFEPSSIDEKITYSQLHVLLALLCSLGFFFNSLSHTLPLSLLILGLLWSYFLGFVTWSWDPIEVFSVSLVTTCFIASHVFFSISPHYWVIALFVQNTFSSLSFESNHILDVAQNSDKVQTHINPITTTKTLACFFLFSGFVVMNTFTNHTSMSQDFSFLVSSHTLYSTSCVSKWKVEI